MKKLYCLLLQIWEGDQVHYGKSLPTFPMSKNRDPFYIKIKNSSQIEFIAKELFLFNYLAHKPLLHNSCLSYCKGCRFENGLEEGILKLQRLINQKGASI